MLTGADSDLVHEILDCAAEDDSLPLMDYLDLLLLLEVCDPEDPCS